MPSLEMDLMPNWLQIKTALDAVAQLLMISFENEQVIALPRNVCLAVMM
jgi:hypothetical protein